MKTKKTLICSIITVIFALAFVGCSDPGGGPTGGGGVAPTITTTTLANGKVETAYSQTLAATGDTPITWSIESGTLPAGLTLSGNTISGTPTTAGTSHFTVKATNDAGSDTKALSIVIATESGALLPAITTTSLPSGTVDTAYSQTLAATGDTPITWSIDTDSGTLPDGLSLDGTTGIISGTPTTAGKSDFTVKATNDAGDDEKELSITIAPIGGDNPTTFTVTFNSNGGTAVAAIPNVTSGATIAKPTDPTKTGNIFGGWYKEAGLTNAWNFTTDTVTDNIELHAKWAAATYTVTFNSNGGSTVSPITGVTSGATITKPADPTKTGNIFGGWYKETGLTTAWNFATDAVNDNIELHAKWTAVSAIYTITDSGTSFTAKKGSATVGTADQPIQDAINAIRADANGDAIAIEFGDGTNPLNIGTGSAEFNNTGGTWGVINLVGKITSANNSATQGTVMIGGGVTVNSTADIAVTSTGTNGRAIYNANTSDGGMVTISGGTVSARTGNAVYNAGTGTVTVSGTAVVTSANVSTTQLGGTVNNSGLLIITGGTVQNTATGTGARAVYNHATVTISGGLVSATEGTAVRNYPAGSTVTITGGTVSATTGEAIFSVNANAGITLGGSPTITGRIRPGATAKLSINGTPAFTPGARVYTLDYAAYTDGMVVVTGGADFLSNFEMYNPSYILEANGSNLVVRIPTPVVADYTFGNLNQTVGSVTAVTITPQTGKSTGARTIYYEGTSGTTYTKSTTLPTAIGTYTVTFDVAAVTGWNAATGLPAGTLTISGVVPTITTTSLADGAVGVPYNVSLSATAPGDSSFITWSIDSGTLPTGLAVTGSSIMGTPSAVGTFNFTVKAANTTGSDTKSLTITVTTAPIGAVWTAISATDSTFGTNYIYGIAFGNNTWVAVGSAGKIARSTNGTTWTAVSTSIFGNSGIMAIAYGNNTFVAVGTDGKMARSTDDGVTWTAVSDSTFGTSYISGIAYGNNTFVAVGDSRKTARSTDNGVTWTAVQFGSGSSVDVKGIAYGNGRFVAVGSVPPGNNGQSGYSTDGANWTLASNLTNTIFNNVTYFGNQFYAVGNNGNSNIGYSPLGTTSTTWNFFTTSGPFYNQNITLYGIASGSSTLVVAGASGRMAYYTERWTAISATVSTFGTSTIYGIAYGNGRFIAVGADGKMAYSVE